MKNLLLTIKWIIGHARTFLPTITVLVVLGSLLSLISVSVAIVSKNLIDTAVSKELIISEKYTALLLIVVFTQISLQSLVNVLYSRTYETISNTIRQKVFSIITQTEWLNFSKYHSGDILTRMTSDIDKVTEAIVNLVPNFISLGIAFIASFSALMYFDPTLALLAFILAPSSVIIGRIFGRKLKHYYIKTQESESECHSFLYESIQNMLVIKSFQLEENQKAELGRLQDKRLKLIFKNTRLSGVSSFVISACYWLSYLLAFVWGAFRLSKGSTSFGTFTAFLQLVNQVQAPLIGLAYTIPQAISSFASAVRLMELESLEMEENISLIPSWKTVGVEFDSVSFSYEHENPVFENASLKISPGEIVAVIGPSGEGKTTLIRLLISIIHPKRGHVYFTGENGEKFEACKSSRAFISYVPQGNTLFSGTIADNLRLGNSNLSDQKLNNALVSACAWDFVNKLPDGISTVLGEHGHGLSEGQAQRIAIARAFLHEAPILILDEATSALDAETEVKVLESIKNLDSARTCIIITHRTKALEICNRVFKIEDGVII